MAGLTHGAALHDKLAHFMGHWVGDPFSWRTSHCCHMPAAWVECAEGVRPSMPPVAHALGATLHVQRGGALAGVVSRALGRAPLGSVGDARIGDVVVYAPGVATPGLLGCAGVVVAEGLAIVSAGPLASLHLLDAAQAAWGIAR